MLTRDSCYVHSPSHINQRLSATLTDRLVKRCAGPQYVKSWMINNEWSAQGDGYSVAVDQYEQKYRYGSISFVDANRFLGEIRANSSNVVAPGLIRLVHQKNNFIATTCPMFIDMIDEEVTIADCLTGAGFVIADDSDYFKTPAFRYNLGKMVISDIIGNDFDDIVGLVKHLRPYGAGELLLQALQLDNERRYLLSLSDITNVKYDIGMDEVGMIVDILELSSVTELITLINMVNALSSLRFLKVIDGSNDRAGVALLLYYALMDGSYIVRIGYDIIHSIAGAGSDGISDVKVGDDSNIVLEFPEMYRCQIPVLRTIETANFEIIKKARSLYKHLLVLRYLQYRGYPLVKTVTIREADRRSFFEVLV